MNCALCGLTENLRDSHILPEFFFKSMYDHKHRMASISSNPNIPIRTHQKGHREKLLCDACEQKLSLLESTAKNQIFDRIWNHQAKNSRDELMLVQLSYPQVRLFFISILWRMGVSSLSLYSKVKLGVHEEILRQMLLSDNPGLPDQYGCIVMFVFQESSTKPHYLVRASPSKVEGQTLYRLMCAGMVLSFFVCSQPVPVDYKAGLLLPTDDAELEEQPSQNGSMLISGIDLEDIDFFQQGLAKIRNKRRA